MKVIYIAGPYSAPTRWEQELRVRDAEYASVDIAKAGACPFCPHTMGRFLDGVGTWEFWMEGLIEVLRGIHLNGGAIYMLPDWKASKGARMEHEFAETWGMPILYSMQDVREYVRKGRRAPKHMQMIGALADAMPVDDEADDKIAARMREARKRVGVV